MRICLFYPSLLSDWRNSPAPFLRGLAMELVRRGHEVTVYEPRGAPSLHGLLGEHGHGPVARFHGAYPGLASRRYEPRSLDLDEALAGAHLVIAHELTEPSLVRRLGEHRAEAGRYRLLFHATESRCMTDPPSLADYELNHFDGVLAAGSVIREQFLAEGWAARAWTWHEGVDPRIFMPISGLPCEGDVVWVGDWPGREHAAELEEFLVEPVRRLGLRARVYGAGYSPEALALLTRAGIEYGGWVPNFELPEEFAKFKVALHLPAREQARACPGLPGSLPFQVLACAVPLVCAVWDDIDGLFQPGVDFGLARDGDELAGWLRLLLRNPDMAQWMASHGQRTVLRRHTSAHRVDALLHILRNLPEAVPMPALIEASLAQPVAV